MKFSTLKDIAPGIKFMFLEDINNPEEQPPVYTKMHNNELFDHQEFSVVKADIVESCLDLEIIRMP
jgi:hypothetical protein